MPINSVAEAVQSASYINIYTSGQVIEYEANSDGFNDIMTAFNSVIYGAYEMPAYGVSLDVQTREAMKEGLWVEFVFNDVREYNGMPFESLLIKVEKEDCGFNLIRKVGGKYEGRCFYLSLAGNMSELSEALLAKMQ